MEMAVLKWLKIRFFLTSYSTGESLREVFWGFKDLEKKKRHCLASGVTTQILAGSKLVEIRLERCWTLQNRELFTGACGSSYNEKGILLGWDNSSAGSRSKKLGRVSGVKIKLAKNPGSTVAEELEGGSGEPLLFGSLLHKFANMQPCWLLSTSFLFVLLNEKKSHYFLLLLFFLLVNI